MFFIVILKYVKENVKLQLSNKGTKHMLRYDKRMKIKKSLTN